VPSYGQRIGCVHISVSILLDSINVSVCCFVVLSAVEVARITEPLTSDHSDMVHRPLMRNLNEISGLPNKKQES
jgi:hypothetical protein